MVQACAGICSLLRSTSENLTSQKPYFSDLEAQCTRESPRGGGGGEACGSRGTRGGHKTLGEDSPETQGLAGTRQLFRGQEEEGLVRKIL